MTILCPTRVGVQAAAATSTAPGPRRVPFDSRRIGSKLAVGPIPRYEVADPRDRMISVPGGEDDHILDHLALPPGERGSIHKQDARVGQRIPRPAGEHRPPKPNTLPGERSR